MHKTVPRNLNSSSSKVQSLFESNISNAKSSSQPVIVSTVPTSTTCYFEMNNTSTSGPFAREGSDLGKTATTVFIVILILLVIFALIGNFTLLTIIISVRKLHSKAHMLLVDLAISDIILAVTVVPIDIDMLVKDGFHHDVTTCEFVSTMFFMSLPASALSLSLLTLERYITLKYPLTRLKILSKKRAIGALVLKWLYVIIIASLPVMGWVYSPSSVGYYCNFYITTQYCILMVTANFLLPLLIILFANIEIFRIANGAALKNKHSLRRVEKRRASFVAVVANVKAAKRIMLLVGLFLVSWLPYITNTVVNISCQGCSPQYITWITMILNYSNATMNPILYGLLNKEIRHEIRKVFRGVSMKLTKSSIERPYLGDSRSECLFSKSMIAERDMASVKENVNETAF